MFETNSKSLHRMVNEKISSSQKKEKALDEPTKHLFLPSGVYFWEVNSKNEARSYFIDSNIDFCTCKGYYYNSKSKPRCYHLSKIRDVTKLNDYSILEYQDKDYSDFAKKIIMDMINECKRTSNI